MDYPELLTDFINKIHNLFIEEMLSKILFDYYYNIHFQIKLYIKQSKTKRLTITNYNNPNEIYYFIDQNVNNLVQIKYVQLLTGIVKYGNAAFDDFVEICFKTTCEKYTKTVLGNPILPGDIEITFGINYKLLIGAKIDFKNYEKYLLDNPREVFIEILRLFQRTNNVHYID